MHTTTMKKEEKGRTTTLWNIALGNWRRRRGREVAG